MENLNPHKNFKTKKDYTKWENFIDQVDAINLSNSDKKRTREAIQYLQSVLGKNFLSEVIQNGHPLLNNYFINAANLARIQLIDFVDKLRQFENSPNFETLVDKIKKATQFSEGLTILEAAHRFHKAGFSTAFDINASFIDGRKPRITKPDIKISNNETSEEIFVEVSEVQASQIKINSSRTYHIIWRLIHDAVWSDPETKDPTNPIHILPYVQIHRSFSEQELILVHGKLQKLIKKVRETSEFQELIIEDVIEAGISPFHDHSKAKEWASKRNLEDFVEGPIIQPNELKRIVNSLVRESDQLPNDKPSIVILWNNANLLFFVHDIETIIRAVADTIADQPNLFCVILNFDFGLSNSESGFFEIGEHLLVSNTGRDLITQTSLIVHNKNFNLFLSDSTREKLLNSFINLSSENVEK